MYFKEMHVSFNEESLRKETGYTEDISIEDCKRYNFEVIFLTTRNGLISWF